MSASPAIAAGVVAAAAAAVVRMRTVDTSGVQLLHAPRTAAVNDKTLLDVLGACPSLSDPSARFVPSALLPTADLQTCYNALAQRLGGPKLVAYERELILTPDGGTLGLDWAPSFASVPPDDRPVVLVAHGLSGGSHEAYVQSTVARLISAPYALRVVVVNFRGCAGVKLTSHVLYNAGATGDFALAVEHVQNRLPGAKMVAVGYSLGANLVTKYAGELGARCPLKGVVSVGNPYDLAASSDAIDEPTLRNRFVYVPAMLQGLLRLYRRHRKMIESGPVQLDTQAISRITTIRQFDDLITARLFGYRDAADYYEQNSSVHFMPDIRVPYLAITALDDPVCPEQYVPRDIFRSNPYLVLALTRFGGHLGFHESPGCCWLPRPIAEFCSAIFSHSA